MQKRAASRVVFAGVQILFGFLLTATSSDRFESLDRLQLGLFGLTITSGLVLVLDMAIGRVPAFVAAGAVLLAMGLLWATVPLLRLR